MVTIDDLTLNEGSNLVIIPGVKGKMGRTYGSAFQKMRRFKTIGITRQRICNDDEGLKSLDLIDVGACQQFVDNIHLVNIRELYLIHATGMFLFEEDSLPIIDTDNDCIDDRIYGSNVETFFNLARPLIHRIGEESKNHPIRLTLCAFGSISDRYSVPFWQSYSKAKDILREFIRSNVGECVRGVFINLSSAEKEEERPFADKTYWLACQEVFNRSMRAILDNGLYWQEIDIFKPNPNYRPDYFFNHVALKEKWLREMGVK